MDASQMALLSYSTPHLSFLVLKITLIKYVCIDFFFLEIILSLPQ